MSEITTDVFELAAEHVAQMIADEVDRRVVVRVSAMPQPPTYDEVVAMIFEESAILADEMGMHSGASQA